jgi:hypothetical protein
VDGRHIGVSLRRSLDSARGDCIRSAIRSRIESDKLSSNVLDAVTKEKDRWSVRASGISLQVAHVVECKAGHFQRQLISILESSYLHLDSSDSGTPGENNPRTAFHNPNGTPQMDETGSLHLERRQMGNSKHALGQ